MISRIIIVWVICILIGAIAQAEADDPVLGKAGDYEIRKSDLDRLLGYYPPETLKQLQENPTEAQTLVRRMLEVKVISDIAKKQKFDQKPEIKEQIKYIVDDFLSREYLARIVMPNIEISETDLKTYYQQNKESLAAPEQVRARHILVGVASNASEDQRLKALAKAEKLLERLRKGESFEEIARLYSDDQSSKKNGGDLGYFTQGRMVREFEDVAFYTDPGEISDIVETRYGYHIIKVEEHREARPRSYEEAREIIRTQLQNQVKSPKIQQFIDDAVASAGMQIDMEKIKESMGKN